MERLRFKKTDTYQLDLDFEYRSKLYSMSYYPGIRELWIKKQSSNGKKTFIKNIPNVSPESVQDAARRALDAEFPALLVKAKRKPRKKASKPPVIVQSASEALPEAQPPVPAKRAHITRKAVQQTAPKEAEPVRIMPTEV